MYEPKFIFILLRIVLLLVSFVPAAHADDWGCEVLLCLSNPAGPEAVAQCVAPISKLWAALAKIPPDPFPTCTAAGAANTASPTRFDPSDIANCPASWVQTITDGNGNVRQACGASGLITVTLNGAVQSRTWWSSAGGSFTFRGSGVVNPQPVVQTPAPASGGAN